MQPVIQFDPELFRRDLSTKAWSELGFAVRAGFGLMYFVNLARTTFTRPKIGRRGQLLANLST
jgi:hypothetical protein